MITNGNTSEGCAVSVGILILVKFYEASRYIIVILKLERAVITMIT